MVSGFVYSSFRCPRLLYLRGSESLFPPEFPLSLAIISYMLTLSMVVGLIAFLPSLLMGILYLVYTVYWRGRVAAVEWFILCYAREEEVVYLLDVGEEV
ncbi:hypothetical protein COLO4_17575 [Corchorus olitorius]|uniref:Uncharacterized protein n=1 Tax=Corchorus olitorius TaxID=93759 RepID=A0A1R3JCE1_9ROSI|nr:hypothetical protein COLO4_17575 [Corchorus olitorius]